MAQRSNNGVHTFSASFFARSALVDANKYAQVPTWVPTMLEAPARPMLKSNHPSPPWSIGHHHCPLYLQPHGWQPPRPQMALDCGLCRTVPGLAGLVHWWPCCGFFGRQSLALAHAQLKNCTRGAWACKAWHIFTSRNVRLRICGCPLGEQEQMAMDRATAIGRSN